MQRQYARLPALLAFIAMLATGAVHADYAKGRAALEKRDFAAAGIEFESAAKAGNAQAMTALGAMYADGLGVERDPNRAFEWFLKSAEAGHVAAQAIVARLYSTGQGVPKNDANALLWARRAAEKGDPESQYIMGIRYAEGRGVKRDSGVALLWFGAAAEQGMVRAQYSAGFLLAQGAAAATLPAHAQQMRFESYKWLLIAERNGATDATKGLASLRKLMTEVQIAEAEKSAASFSPINPNASTAPAPAKP